MSTPTSLLLRPSTLGALAVAGSGAFYVGLKYRTLTLQPQPGTQRDDTGKSKSYEVKPGREGGGV